MNNGEMSGPIDGIDPDVPRDTKDATEDIGLGYSDLLDPQTLEIDPARIDGVLEEDALDALEKREEALHEKKKSELLHNLRSKKTGLKAREQYQKQPEGTMMDYLWEISEELQKYKGETKVIQLLEIAYEAQRRLEEVVYDAEGYDLLMEALATTNISELEEKLKKSEDEEATYDRTHAVGNSSFAEQRAMNDPEYKAIIAERGRLYQELRKAREISQEVIPMLETIKRRITEKTTS